MKIAFLSFLLCCSCANHRQLTCRFVAVNAQGTILKSPTAQMHSHWHKGMQNCAGMIGALEDGFVTETVTGDKAGVEVRGPKSQRKRLQQLFAPLPQEPLNTTEVRPFKVLTEVAE